MKSACPGFSVLLQTEHLQLFAASLKLAYVDAPNLERHAGIYALRYDYRQFAWVETITSCNLRRTS